MATERKNGAGLRLSGVLERAGTPPEPTPRPADEPEHPVEPAEGDRDRDLEPADAPAEPSPRGRGAAARKSRTLAARAARRIKGRTIYMADDLFERLLVQSHRRGMTISDYVASILEKAVPDHLAGGRAETDRHSA